MPWPAITAKWSAPPLRHMYTQGPHLPSFHAHASDIHQVCMDACAALTDLQEETFLCCHTDPSHANQNTRNLLAPCFYPLYQTSKHFFVLCWCVHIAYVSIWCPVDIVVLNLDFTDICGFYIPCGVGEKRGWGWELFVFYKAVHWEIHSSSTVFKIQKCRCIA